MLGSVVTVRSNLRKAVQYAVFATGGSDVIIVTTKLPVFDLRAQALRSVQFDCPNSKRFQKHPPPNQKPGPVSAHDTKNGSIFDSAGTLFEKRGNRTHSY